MLLNRILRLALLPVIAVMLLSNVALAASVAQNQTILTAAYQYADCKTNFAVGLMNDVINASPSLETQLNASIAALNRDTDKLYTFANAGNLKQFQSYLTETYDPELANVSGTLSSDYKTANFPSNTLAALRSDYNASMAVYNDCALNATKSYGNAKVAIYESYIAEYQNVTNTYGSLASKYGIDYSSLTAIVDNATPQVITPLQNGISGAKNASQVKAVLGEYCMLNDCPNGYNYHLDARLYTQALTIAYNKLQSVNIGGIINSTQMNELNSNIQNATLTVNSAGSNTYSSSQENSLFANLNNGLHVLGKIINSLRGLGGLGKSG